MKWYSEPFLHGVATNLFDPYLLQRCADEMPDPDDGRWRRYGNQHEMKLEGPPAMWGSATWEYFDLLRDMAGKFEEWTGITGLELEMVGGGYHLIPPGGYLGVHTDFSRSPRSGLYRRLNVLTYLNRDWTDDGGRLELWDAERCVRTLAPEFGTTAVFATSSVSWHGHPKPAQRWRASLAAYWFAPDPPDGFAEQSTVWHSNA